MTYIDHHTPNGFLESFDVSQFEDSNRSVNIQVNDEGIVFDLFDVEPCDEHAAGHDVHVESKWYLWEDLADWINDR